jgi:hypothetical protein
MVFFPLWQTTTVSPAPFPPPSMGGRAHALNESRSIEARIGFMEVSGSACGQPAALARGWHRAGPSRVSAATLWVLVSSHASDEVVPLITSTFSGVAEASLHWSW